MASSRQLVDARERWSQDINATVNHPPPRRRGKPKSKSSEKAIAKLASTIEREVIPRLLLAHSRPGVALLSKQPDLQTASEQVVAFTDLVLTQDIHVALSHVEALRKRGVALETIILDLLAPTARRLGELWEADVCDFTEVTVGLSRLQQVLRDLSPAFENEVCPRETGHRVLLVPAPGEQHTFGLYMVEEFFRRAGWDVSCGPQNTALDLANMVRDEWFTVVGLSLSCETRLDALAFGIRSVRRASRNKNIGVMVGGRVFVERPELVVLIGADATASNAKEAVVQAQNLVGTRLQGC